jgi:hypothetical protein
MEEASADPGFVLFSLRTTNGCGLFESAFRAPPVAEDESTAAPCTGRDEGRIPIHRDQLRVRAYENESYIVITNWAGPVFKGHSMIINPKGEALRLGGHHEEILAAELDMDDLKQLRAGGIYGRRHRQPRAYGPLLKADGVAESRKTAG